MAFDVDSNTKRTLLRRVSSLVERLRNVHNFSGGLLTDVSAFEADLVDIERNLARQIDDYMDRQLHTYNYPVRPARTPEECAAMKGLTEMRLLKRAAGMLLLCLLLPLTAHAQTITGLVLSPVTVEFDPSPDHGVTSLSGTPLVSEYRARYFLNAETVLDKAHAKFDLTLGKPTAGANGKIAAVNVFGGLIANTVYKAVVVAVGPGGEGVSAPSNPFAVEQLPAPRAVPNPPVIRGGGI